MSGRFVAQISLMSASYQMIGIPELTLVLPIESNPSSWFNSSVRSAVATSVSAIIPISVR